MPYQRILLEKANYIATLTLNRPEKHNALDMVFFREFGQCMDELKGDEDTRVIIITGAGRSFCSGVDFGDLAQAIGDPSLMAEGLGDLSQPFGPLQAVPRSLHTSHKPVIAAINGFTSGMGLALVCLCDYRIASERATFAPGFINLGLAGELGLTYLLPRITGLPVAFQFLSAGETRDASWAKRSGLVSEVVPSQNLMEAAYSLGGKLAQMPPVALGILKQLLYQGQETSFDFQLRFEFQAASRLIQTEDCQEAMRATLEKRPPVFKGR
jgi:2-(1,2-epoxy-1,2-dihydrophenyl)acetyl-CoA isomerase